MKIRIKFASNEYGPVTIPTGSTLSCIKQNEMIAMDLGYDQGRVNFVVNGVAASDDTVLNDGDVVNVQHRAHEKAA